MDTRILGDYTIIKSIGQGTLGTVYLAEHRFMKRQYVLKVLPEELASDRAFIQRFEEDVAKLATLEHPHIVKIHNISHAQGLYFLVMDCIVDDFGETTNLAQYIAAREKRFDEEELFRLLHQVADALDYAHQKRSNTQELVHRGLKLNNILIGKGRGSIELHLSDFGLSRIIGPGAVLTRTYKNVAEALSISSALTSQKAHQEHYPNPPIETQKLTQLHLSFLQNYGFLAPEQKRLDSHYPVDAKADVYAFGVLTYYLLMRELPEGIFDMPSSRPGYRWDWDSLIIHCLQHDPAKRPDDLVDVLASIRQTERFALKETVKEMAHETKVQELEPVLATMRSAIKEQEESMFREENAPQVASVGHNSAVLKPVISNTQLERPDTDSDPAAAFRIDQTVKIYHPEQKEIPNIQPILTDMSVIQGGAFMRGSKDGNRDEMPCHQITLCSYAIDIHPVTNEQFVRFLEVMGGEKDSNHHDIIRMRDSRIKRTGGRLSIESGYSKHPVVGVTWYGAIAYAKWIGKRLPTEAEWEIAARAGWENLLYPTGEDIEKNQANFFSADTTAVMSYAPTDNGLYDMAGNVYEWCYDWYGYNYYELSVQEPESPKGPLQGVYRVLRGGCWKSLKEDLRCSRRHRNNPGTVNGTYGFRCAANVQSVTK
jgi:formylglycine-generating enzyme required for sulfatase activity